jgi:phage tail tape-measure protein
MAAEERDERHADASRDDESTTSIAGAGAAAGAIAGATVGSVAGPLGTAAGAVGGAVVGGITAGIAGHGNDTGPEVDKELPDTRRSAAPHDPLAAGQPQEAGNRPTDSSGDL